MAVGKKIYVLHGWSYTLNKWTEFEKTMIQAGFKPVMLKVPGLTEDTQKVWTLDEYVAWLDKKIEEDEVVLIGHSNGGRIAIAFAHKYPKRVKQLILIDSAGICQKGMIIQTKRLIFGVMAKFGKKLTSSVRMRNLLYKIARESDYKNASPQLRQTMVNLINTDLTLLLQEIVSPTLIIWGKLDRITPLATGLKMNQLIKKSRLVVINEAKHSPQFTHCREVCKNIINEIN